MNSVHEYETNYIADAKLHHIIASVCVCVCVCARVCIYVSCEGVHNYVRFGAQKTLLFQVREGYC